LYGTYLSNYTREKLRKQIGPNAKLPKYLCNFKRLLTVWAIFFQSLNVKLNGNLSHFDYFIRTERPIEGWTDGAVQHEVRRVAIAPENSPTYLL